MGTRAYAYLAVALLWLATVVGAYGLGVKNTKDNIKIEEGKEAKAVIAKVEKRIPVVIAQDKQAGNLERETARLREELRNAIKASKTVDPSCDLSDDELRLFNSASERTRSLL